MTPALIAVQLNSQDDLDGNLNSIQSLLAAHWHQHPPAAPPLVVLPENALCFAPGQQHRVAERHDALRVQLADLARQFQMYLVAGTLPCPYRPDGRPVPDGRLRATCLMFAPDGQLLGRYDKIHLFDVDVPDGIGRYQESAVYEPGEAVVCVATPWGRVGLMVCYDVRFPELALQLRQQGADVLTVPAAFTYPTGQLHWELLLRARAVDAQCAVVGSAQTGWHGQRQTWGHSMVTDARGRVLARLDDPQAGVLQADWPATDQQRCREAMPLLAHRRLHRDAAARGAFYSDPLRSL